MRVNFAGEAADDHGGPYREAIAHICGELQSDVLPLFISCPNGVHGLGNNRDAFVPNPSACAPQHMEWYCFVGQLLALALRQRETQLNMTLPSVVWKQLAAQPMDGDDLSGFDAMSRQSLDKLRFIDQEGIDADLFGEILRDSSPHAVSGVTRLANLAVVLALAAMYRPGHALESLDSFGSSYLVPRLRILPTHPVRS